MYLLIRSDSPEAQIVLVAQDSSIVDRHTWEAGRELSVQLLTAIKDILAKNSLAIKDVEGWGCYEGPGSFTGLRISHAVVNAFSYATSKPVVNAAGDDWVQKIAQDLTADKNSKVVVPDYGRGARITKPRK